MIWKYSQYEGKTSVTLVNVDILFSRHPNLISQTIASYANWKEFKCQNGRSVDNNSWYILSLTNVIVKYLPV